MEDCSAGKRVLNRLIDYVGASWSSMRNLPVAVPLRRPNASYRNFSYRIFSID